MEDVLNRDSSNQLMVAGAAMKRDCALKTDPQGSDGHQDPSYVIFTQEQI